MKIARRRALGFQVGRRGGGDLLDLGALSVSRVQTIEHVVDRTTDALGRAAEHHHAGPAVVAAAHVGPMHLGLREWGHDGRRGQHADGHEPRHERRIGAPRTGLCHDLHLWISRGRAGRPHAENDLGAR